MTGEARQRRRVIAGSLIIAGLLAVAVLIFFLDAIVQRYRRTYEIVAVMAEAPGLTSGSPVWIGGRVAGEVTRVEIKPPLGDTLERVAVTLVLPVRHREQVRADSRVRVTSERLISEPVVDIIPGTEAAPVLRAGDTLRQDLRLTPHQLTVRAAVVRQDMDAVLTELRALAPSVRRRMEQTQRAFASAELALEEARRIRSGFAANPGMQALRDPAFAESLDRARSHAAALPQAIGTLRERAGAGSEVGVALARLQTRADTLRERLGFLDAALADPNSSLARFQQDTALVRALNAARMELDSLVADVRRRPLRYLF